MRKSNQRRARHLESLQYAVIHQRHLLRRNSLIVKLVVAEQIFVAQFLPRCVVHDAQKGGKNRLANLLRKRLSLGNVAHKTRRKVEMVVVKEHGRSASRQQCRSNSRLVDRRRDQTFHLFAQCRARHRHRLVVRSFLRVHPVKVVIALDVHSIRRFSLNKKLQPVANLPELQLRPLRIHLKYVLRQRAERHNRIQNRRRFAERLRIRAHSFFPRLAVQRERNLRPK